MNWRSLKRLAPAAVALALLAPAAASGAATSPRVVGGSAASIAKYPWQGAVVLSGGGSAYNRLFCGGVLVTPSIVLTAAHCVYDTHPAPPLCPALGPGSCQLQPGDVDVVLGRTTLSDTSQGEEFSVQATAYQPGYSASSGQNDVGYLVLSHPAPVANTIKIAGADESSLWTPGRATEISGWGSTSEGGPISNTLMAATAPIISDSGCGSAYPGQFFSGSMVCAGYLGGGIDTCSGDSGGPLQAPIQGGGYRLVGLTNFGQGCARAGFPGVYARVAGSLLRPAVQNEVYALESARGLSHFGIVGSGAQPPGSTAPRSAAKKAVKKCKRIHNRHKRKRCIKRAKRLA